MAGEDDGKTEAPTGRRLDEAREKGDVAQSVEVRLWASLVAAFIVVTLLPAKIGRDLANAVLPLIERPHTFHITTEFLPVLLAQLGWAVFKVLAWPFAVVIVVTVGALVLQTGGFMWVPNKLMPDFGRLDPLKGIQRLFSANQLVELFKQMLKMLVVGVVLVWMTWPHMAELRHLSRLDLLGILSYMHDRVFALTLAVVLMATALTAGDYWYQRWRYTQKMRMTRQEVRDEHKQSEGDPMVKGRLRSMRMKRARQRMMQAVPKADVVVTNPTHFAVALKYDMDSMSAPVLVAKGADLVAKRIRDLADEHEVPIVENPPLARALFATVELDQEIPPEHYKTVAEVIGYVMRLKGKLAH